MSAYASGERIGRRLLPGVLAGLLLAILLSLLPTDRASADETLRLAVLKYGTASWELEVIRRHQWDQAEGIKLAASEFAGTQATLVALQAGDIDIAITDWIWVSRQRDQGRPFTFAPYSTAIGSLMVPAGSPITSLADLKGKRLGIAGGPLDKNWLLLRALALRQTGLDLETQVEPVYGAPPLLNEQIRQKRIDAVVNHWPYAARLAALGYTRLIDLSDAGQSLGVTAQVPMLGYVFDERWAKDHPTILAGFLRAADRAKQLLLESDQAWEAVRPLMRVDDDATFIALRQGYRAGIPRQWREAERAGAEQLFAILRAMGGTDLVGDADRLAPGTFWEHMTR